jgi:hypothetical protein
MSLIKELSDVIYIFGRLGHFSGITLKLIKYIQFTKKKLHLLYSDWGKWVEPERDIR